ncbi:general transcription factor 3C polypeptide 6 [Harpegnathos saltator]|uniref:General transcription factor 3C polypeptide 6 n=1 Tax=Harpegnathos saltator TaxID=610380 RepID=E2BM70_HARSA|nr:general transcription factor 3C polypeptide 6 [Harpegnathos saltator]XP_011141450.1 general transcription factor 3C polypeptide 6 [Harpegnathos saltator]EFN83196.1 General transcription factor 3C polypeptide 6 [Harpegnathos saltator]
MQSDDDLSEDEEEILVYVEFEDLVGSNMFSNEDLQLDMIGLDTEHPIMQVNGRYYEGVYEDAVGTYMFFEKDDDPHVDDIIFDKVPTLKYFAKTRKLLKMQRVFAKPKVELFDNPDISNCIPNINALSQAGVPLKYQQDALEFWSILRDEKLKELSTCLEKQKITEKEISQDTVPDSESSEKIFPGTSKSKKEAENI